MKEAPLAHIAAQRALTEAQRHTRETVRKFLADLDPAEPHTLRFAAKGLLSANFEQKELAELVGVSRTTIGRWAQGQNIPRSPPFRRWIVESFCSHLTKALELPEAQEPDRPLPHHAAGYVRHGT